MHAYKKLILSLEEAEVLQVSAWPYAMLLLFVIGIQVWLLVTVYVHHFYSCIRTYIPMCTDTMLLCAFYLAPSIMCEQHMVCMYMNTWIFPSPHMFCNVHFLICFCSIHRCNNSDFCNYRVHGFYSYWVHGFCNYRVHRRQVLFCCRF